MWPLVVGGKMSNLGIKTYATAQYIIYGHIVYKYITVRINLIDITYYETVRLDWLIACLLTDSGAR